MGKSRHGADLQSLILEQEAKIAAKNEWLSYLLATGHPDDAEAEAALLEEMRGALSSMRERALAERSPGSADRLPHSAARDASETRQQTTKTQSR